MTDVRSLAAAAAFSFVAAAPATHQVAIRDNAFEPATITVAVNDTVTWTNRGANRHTVDIDGELPSGPIEPGRSHSDTFTTAGNRAYHCSIHPSMTGTINVQAASATTSSSSSSTTTTLRRSVSTTTTTDDPLGSSVTAPPDSTTTSSSLVDDTTTTSSTAFDAAATRVTDTASGGGDNVDVDIAGGVAAILLLLTAGATLVLTRGGFR